MPKFGYTMMCEQSRPDQLVRDIQKAEEAGFDSVWSSEHHFSDYQITPQMLMFLAWVAGQTTRVRLGTMVTVLPWHDPVRVAESFSVLDHLSGGRAILGAAQPR